MERQRTSDDFNTVGDIFTLIPGAEKAQFYCEGGREGDAGVPPGMGGALELGKCGKNLTSFNLKKLPNGKDFFVRCPRCGRSLYANAGWLIASAMKAVAQKKAGGAPAVGTFHDINGHGHATLDLPDGRKLIIARPRGAAAGARARGT